MDSKETLLKISGLNLSNRINNMDAKQFQLYCKYLDEFVDTFPSEENTLRENVRTFEYDSLSHNLTALSNRLAIIYADNLVDECKKLKEEIKTENHQLIDENLSNLLTLIAALSIDIQMTRLQGQYNQAPEANVEETQAPVVKSILAVDDVSLILFTLKTILADTDYNFVGVTTGVAALKYLTSHTPDLFVLDIEMPEMNGYELAKAIRTMGQTAPIIFLTGNATKKYVINAIQAGAADFIVKPINVTQVLEKIEKNIRR